MNRKRKSLYKQCFYQNTKIFAVAKSTTRVRMLSFGTDTVSFCALSMMIRCLKSAQKSAVQVCQVAAIAMEAKMQAIELILSQFKNILAQ